VVKDEPYLGRWGAPSVEMKDVAAVLPPFFDGGVTGCKGQPRREMALDILPCLLVGVARRVYRIWRHDYS
jgi:hypothetical protein